MNAITAVPWHVYLTMFVFAVTVGLLAAFEVQELRNDRPAMPQCDDSLDEVEEA